jgi:hypothetical protein
VYGDGTSRVYYRGHDIVVTDRSFDTGVHRFVIAELRDPYSTRESSHRGRAAAVAAATGLALAIVAAILRSPIMWVVAAGVLAVTSMVAVVVNRIRPRNHQLWASYRGLRVLLLTSPDERAFRQVIRALVRAIESNAWSRENPWR